MDTITNNPSLLTYAKLMFYMKIEDPTKRHVYVFRSIPLSDVGRINFGLRGRVAEQQGFATQIAYAVIMHRTSIQALIFQTIGGLIMLKH